MTLKKPKTHRVMGFLKERLERKAEKRHGDAIQQKGGARRSGGSKQEATMAHLRAAQRWDALRTQVYKAKKP